MGVKKLRLLKFLRSNEDNIVGKVENLGKVSHSLNFDFLRRLINAVFLNLFFGSRHTKVKF